MSHNCLLFTKLWLLKNLKKTLSIHVCKGTCQKVVRGTLENFSKSIEGFYLETCLHLCLYLEFFTAQNEVLVTELMNRDSLHLKQDSLLMDVEDASK